MSEKKYKLAVVTTHPIEFQGPLFREISKEPEIDLTVNFLWDFGIKESYDKDFGAKVKWDSWILEGYNFKLLKNIAPHPTSAKFWGAINLGVWSELSSKKYNAVLVLGWQVFSMWFAVICSKLRGIAVFLRGENPLNQEMLKPGWKRFLKQLIFRPFFALIDTIFYISEENKKFYNYYGVSDKKLIFMPYAHDNKWLMAKRDELKPERAKLRSELIGMHDERMVIMFSGKLIDKKRPLDLLHAYHALIQKVQPGELEPALVYVGDGPLRAEVEKYVAEYNLKNVQITGFKNPTDVPNYYAAADVYVQASGAGDTAPFPVNEAMCFGLPILISDLIGTAYDRVHPGENGYVFPYRNIPKLSAYLIELYGDPAKRAEFGRRSIEIISEVSYENDILALRAALKSVKP